MVSPAGLREIRQSPGGDCGQGGVGAWGAGGFAVSVEARGTQCNISTPLPPAHSHLLREAPNTLGWLGQ